MFSTNVQFLTKGEALPEMAIAAPVVVLVVPFDEFPSKTQLIMEPVTDEPLNVTAPPAPVEWLLVK